MVIRAATRGLVSRAWLSAYPWCFRTTVCSFYLCAFSKALLGGITHNFGENLSGYSRLR